MPIELIIKYRCDKCGFGEQFIIENAEFYSDYMLHPEGIDHINTTNKWYDNILYPATGEWEDGDYELLCENCYITIKELNK